MRRPSGEGDEEGHCRGLWHVEIWWGKKLLLYEYKQNMDRSTNKEIAKDSSAENSEAQPSMTDTRHSGCLCLMHTLPYHCVFFKRMFPHN